MIRDFVRRSRKPVAALAMSGMVLTGAPTLAAAQWVVRKGGAIENVDPSTNQRARWEASTLKEVTEKMRRAQGQPGMFLERHKRVLELLEISAITDKAERRARIRALPVKLIDEPAEGGIWRSVIVRGQLRARVFRPAKASPQYQEVALPSSAATEIAEQPDGATSGPEVTPVSDSTGAGAVAALVDLCEDEEGWAECATDQEIADGDMLMGAYDYEADVSIAEAEQVSAGLDSYCEQNPWDCQADVLSRAAVDETDVHDGEDCAGASSHDRETAEAPCFAEAVLAVGGAVFAKEVVTSKWGLFKAAARITSRAALAALGGAAVAVAVGVATVAIAANCYMQLASPPLSTLTIGFMAATRVFEPARGVQLEP